MQIITIILMGVFFSSFGYSENIQFKTYSSQDKKYQQIQTSEIGGLRISANCLKNGKPSCLAWNAAKNKIKRDPSSMPLAGNPAGKYCMEHKAMNRIFFDSKSREFDYCVFSDGSSIDAWSLYNKHYGKNN